MIILIKIMVKIMIMLKLKLKIIAIDGLQNRKLKFRIYIQAKILNLSKCVTVN